MAKKACEKAGVPFLEEMKRAPLKLCIDPEFGMLTPFIKQVRLHVFFSFSIFLAFFQAEPEKKGTSIYEEVDPKVFLDLYGNEIPVKVLFLSLKFLGLWILQPGTCSGGGVEYWTCIVYPSLFRD